MRQKKGFPIWGKLSAKRTDEGKAYVAVIKTGNKANFPLIRRCGATFSLRAKSRLRRLRSDTRLRAQPHKRRQDACIIPHFRVQYTQICIPGE